MAAICAFAASTIALQVMPQTRAVSGAPLRGAAAPGHARVSMAGFGAPRQGGGARRPRPRETRATYRDLVSKGAKEHVCYARAENSGEAGWKRVGTIVAENDNCCVAVSNTKRVVLEHAKRLHPQLAMVKVLEVGFGAEGEDAPVVCPRSEESCTSAFSPDAVATDPYYVSRMGDGRVTPVDVSSKRSAAAFPPRRIGEGKTPLSP